MPTFTVIDTHELMNVGFANVVEAVSHADAFFKITGQNPSTVSQFHSPHSKTPLPSNVRVVFIDGDNGALTIIEHT